MFTVQEELGLRAPALGLTPSTHVGIAVDVTGWGDTPSAPRSTWCWAVAPP